MPGYRRRDSLTRDDEEVRQSIASIEASPFIPRKDVRGFVYQVEDGALREVS